MMRTCLAAVVALLLVAPARGDQGAMPRGLVAVHVIVETSLREPVRGLTADEFEIVQDGTARPIAFFSAEPPPLTLVVLLDLTRSVADTRRAVFGPEANLDLKPSLQALLSQLADADRVRLGRIAATVSVGPPLGRDPNARARGIDLAINAPDADRGGPSPVWDAIDAAVTSIEREPGRLAVIVVTDGMATGNRLSLAAVADHAANANVSVSAIGFEAPVTIRQNRTTVIEVKPEVLLQGIAGYTGGVYRTPSRVTPPEIPVDPFATIVGTLRTSYTLGFRGEADGKPHPIEVRVKRPGLTIHARKAYVAGSLIADR